MCIVMTGVIITVTGVMGIIRIDTIDMIGTTTTGTIGVIETNEFFLSGSQDQVLR